MGLPKTALKENKLKPLKADSTTPKSGHEVTQVEFVDFDGVTKKGWFKRLDKSYPELLAKIAVGTSVILKLSLGERAAEDRLVYDENDLIAGTLSIAIEGFKPFNYSSETNPLEKNKIEEVNPSCLTLIEHNVMELLFFSWFLDNDDLHPKNMGLKGLIDYDMFFYAVTEIIKGPRDLGGSAYGKVELSVRDFCNYLVLEDSKRTHWPTKAIPENKNYFKRYLNYEQYIKLSTNPASDSSPTITAEEQLFSAAIKALVTYQPKMLEKRLKDALGTEALNYTALEKAKQSELEKKFGNLFCLEKNTQPFTQFMKDLYQLYYDELYRNIVFSRGCEKNCSGIAVPAFYHFLFHHPSSFKHIQAWMNEQNEQLEHLQKKCSDFANEPDPVIKNDIACAAAFQKATKSDRDKKRHFNKEETSKRYHQIWRDSFTLWIKDVLYRARDLTCEVQQKLSLNNTKTSSELLSDSFEPLERFDKNSSITNACELLSPFAKGNSEQIMGRIHCETNNDMRTGLPKLVELYNYLLHVTKIYLSIPLEELTTLNNNQFINSLRELVINYIGALDYLGENTSWGKKCSFIATNLDDLANTANFPIHLYGTDKTMTSLTPYREITREHTDPKVINECMIALFDWIDQLKPKEFEQKIIKIIDTEYTSIIHLYRQRAEPVKAYLRDSKNISGDNRLGYILTSAETNNGALNTLLVERLIDEMLPSTNNDINVYLPSVRTAIAAKNFDRQLYTTAAIEYAKMDSRFKHVYSDYACKTLNSTMYQWVDSKEPPQFAGCIESALKAYESTKSYFTTSRRKEVTNYLDKPYSNSKTLACIFLNGGFESTSLNTVLFNKILDAMCKDIKGDDKKSQQDNYQLILALETEPRSHFIESLKHFAEAASKRTEHVVDHRLQLTT